MNLSYNHTLDRPSIANSNIAISALIWAISIFFVDLTFAANFILPITLSLILLPLVIFQVFIFTREFDGNTFLYIVLISIIPPIQFIFSSLPLAEFLFTYLYFLLFSLCLMLAVSSARKEKTKGFLILSVKYLGWLMFGSAVLIIVQAILLNIFGSYATIPALGPFHPDGPGSSAPYAPHPLATYKRPSGFYSEPSVAGWSFLATYALIAIWRSALRPQVARLVKAALVVATLSTLALSSILGLAAIILLDWWTARRSRGAFVKIAQITLAPVAIGIGLLGIMILLGPRLSNLATDSSAYLRVFGPLQLIAETLQSYPLGRPFGSIESSDIFFLNWADEFHRQIDNTLLLFIFHFGFIGLIIVGGVLIWLVRMVISRRRESLALASLLVIFFSTGAGWTPKALSVGFLLMCTLFTYRRWRAQ